MKRYRYDPYLERYDGLFENEMTGLGVRGRDVSASTRVSRSVPVLQRFEAENLLRDALVYRYITALPSSATSRGWRLVFGSDDTDGKIPLADRVESYWNDRPWNVDRLSISDYFYEAQVEANVGDGYRGGACLVYDIDDGRPPSEPVDVNKIRSIEGIYLVGVHDLCPDTIYTDASGASRVARTRHQITHYRLLLPELVGISRDRVYSSKNSALRDYTRLHKSRLLRFDGVRFTSRMEIDNYSGWSGSRIPLIYNDFCRYNVTMDAIPNIVQTSSTLVHKIKDLAATLASSDDNATRRLEKYFRDVRTLASVFGGVVTDMEQSDLDYLSRQFNGLDGIVASIRDSFIGASGIPHTQLFGESPSGLGATGESEEKDWARAVKAFQKTNWHKNLRKHYSYIFLAKDGPTKGKMPDTWDIEYESIVEMTPEQELSLEQTKSTIDSTYIGLQVLSAKEVRKNRYGGSRLSLQTVLDDALYEEEMSGGEDPYAATAEDPYAADDLYAAEPAAVPDPGRTDGIGAMPSRKKRSF